MDRLESLEVYVRVIDLGGFAPAARALKRSPTMIAKHIDTLEATLGTRLLNRTTRALSATDVGLAYYDRARAILAEYEAASREAAAQQTSPHGVLRISLPGVFSAVISPVLAQFAAENPAVSLHLQAENRTVDLLDERIDLAIRGGILPNSSLIASKLAPVSVIVCASPAYIARRGAPTTLETLSGHECIAYAERSSGDVWTFVDRQDGTERNIHFPNIRHRANDADGQRALAIEGLGLIRLPEPLVRADIAQGRLVTLLGHVPEATRWLHAVYLPGRTMPLATRRLIEFLKARLTKL